MTELIDTHTHLYVPEFQQDIESVVARAVENGVAKFCLPAIDRSETESISALEKKYPGRMFAMAGLHPCSVKENFRDELDHISKQLEQRKFIAVGETGLDFYWDTTFSKTQVESLHIHAAWGIQYDIPLVLHTRNAMQETIDEIKPYQSRGLRGIFHCFSGDLAQAKEITGMGFLLGIGGVITFKNSGVAAVIRELGLEHVVLETDAPYLAPVPKRGKRNESAYLKYVADYIAGLLGVSAETVAEITTRNAKNIFSFDRLESLNVV